MLGDSITAGFGLDRDQAYPAILQQKLDAAGLPFSVVNAGVSGDTTAGGVRRVDWALGPGADVLIIALGGNDGLRGISPKQTEENLREIIKRARAKAPEISVIIAGMEMPGNMGKEFVEQFRAVFPRVAAETSAALVPFLLEGVGGVPELNQADMIHPTPEGQKRVAENVWKVLEKVLKRETAKAGKMVDFVDKVGVLCMAETLKGALMEVFDDHWGSVGSIGRSVTEMQLAQTWVTLVSLPEVELLDRSGMRSMLSEQSAHCVAMPAGRETPSSSLQFQLLDSVVKSDSIPAEFKIATTRFTSLLFSGFLSEMSPGTMEIATARPQLHASFGRYASSERSSARRCKRDEELIGQVFADRGARREIMAA